MMLAPNCPRCRRCPSNWASPLIQECSQVLGSSVAEAVENAHEVDAWPLNRAESDTNSQRSQGQDPPKSDGESSPREVEASVPLNVDAVDEEVRNGGWEPKKPRDLSIDVLLYRSSGYMYEK